MFDSGLHVRESGLCLLQFQKQVPVLGILIGSLFGGLAQLVGKSQVHFVVRDAHRFLGQSLLFWSNCQSGERARSRQRAFVYQGSLGGA